MTSNSQLLSQLVSGDEKAEEALVENNMGLVYKIATKFYNRGYDKEDLIQIGALGLIKAVKKFDVEYGVQFSTYAVPMIIGEIKRFLRDDGMVKVSRSLKEIAIKGKRCEERLREKLDRTPTISEIAKECGIDATELLEAFDATMPVESIYKSQDDDSKLELINVLGNTEENEIIDKLFVSKLLDELNDREREVIKLRYYEGKTQTEISKLMGVSQVQISRIEKKALLNMRNACC